MKPLFLLHDQSVMGAAILSDYSSDSSQAAGLSREEWIEQVEQNWFGCHSHLYISIQDYRFVVANDKGMIFSSVDDLGGIEAIGTNREEVEAFFCERNNIERELTDTAPIEDVIGNI